MLPELIVKFFTMQEKGTVEGIPIRSEYCILYTGA